MWYVMQVISGQESRTALLAEKMISQEILENSFVPMRRLRKKFHGAWHEVREKLFPGYVFLISEQPRLLYEELKKIPAMTKVLGRSKEYFTPLSAEDVRMLEKLQNGASGGHDTQGYTVLHAMRTGGLRPIRHGNLEVEISRIAVEEGREIRVLSGPLKNLEGQVKKVNLHKRVAAVEIEFMGKRSLVHLGIEMVE